MLRLAAERLAARYEKPLPIVRRSILTRSGPPNERAGFARHEATKQE
jgi:hypothetical protein